MLARFLDDLHSLRPGAAPDDATLGRVADLLLGLARGIDAHAWDYRKAQPGEELLYPLHEDADGPSLYLVSDGAGVASAPHEHRTWAVIVGLAGNELNVLYDVDDAARRTVSRRSQARVGRLDALALGAGAIHATLALDGQPTYHLHLYGRALRVLPPYASRCYTEV